MASDDWPEWLPANWTVQIRKVDERKVKCYIDPEGHKFYSKPQVDQRLKSLSNTTDNGGGSGVDLSLEPGVPHTNEVPQLTPRPRGRPRKTTPGSSSNKSRVLKWLTPRPRGRPRKTTPGSSSNKSRETTGGLLAGDGSSVLESSQRKNGESKWLPDGWTVEFKTREKGGNSGSKYKIYVDPVSGRKFHSKPQVLNYLASKNNSGAKQEEKNEATGIDNDDTPKATKSFSMSTADDELISSTPADGLPPGWVKEIRMRKNGKKDPYYVDPLSGNVFLSKLDALRYLDTGDVKNCVMRTMKRDVNKGDIRKVRSITEDGHVSTTPDASRKSETSDWLPDGWVVEVNARDSGAKVKCYKESATGRKFYSKPQVLSYLELGNSSNSRKKKRKVRSITGDGFMSTPDASRKSEVSEWLPDGWVVEVNTRDTGAKVKCYKESATGRTFYSKPQVLSYLQYGNSSNSRKRKGGKPSSADSNWSPSSRASDAKRQKGSAKKGRVPNSDYTEVIIASPADGLPPGWIKEIRTKKYATHERRDPYYTDPSTGYVFRSKMDALRYLGNGDVNSCAIRPKKKDADGNEVYVDEPKRQNPKKAKQLFEDEGDDPETGASRSSKGTRSRPARSRKPLAGETSERPKSSEDLAKEKEGATDVESNGVVEEKQVSGVDLEKQGDVEHRVDGEGDPIPDWLDFAAATLPNPGDMNETPTKVNGNEEGN